jgi:hypothetical protein
MAVTLILTTSVRAFTTPPLPPGTPPPCRPSMPTHMRASSRHWHCQIQCARKKLTLTILSTDVLQRCQKWTLLVTAKFSGREALLTKQITRPSSQQVYLWPAYRLRWTALWKTLFQKAPRGGSIFPTSSSSTQRAHKSHINSNKYFLLVLMT